jgi:hypothetical protein
VNAAIATSGVSILGHSGAQEALFYFLVGWGHLNADD